MPVRDPLPPLPAPFRLTPAFRLLLASSWIAPAARATAQAERIKAACDEGVDWHAFLSLVDRHRVIVPPGTLHRAAGPDVPAWVDERLQARKAEACRQALAQAAELVRLQRALGSRGIEILPLKGVMLSVQLFGDPAMRTTRDLDLLVAPGQVDEADQILGADGYRRTHPDCTFTPRRKRWILCHGHHFGYLHGERRQVVELHWRFPSWTTAQVAELWNHGRAADWMGTNFLNLAEDALLLFQCDHGARHRWRRIKWLADVATLFAREPGFNWPNLLALADRLDLNRPLAEAGLLVHWLYGLPLPEPLVALIAGRNPACHLACDAVAAMLLDEEGQFALAERLRTGVSLGRLRERLPRSTYLTSCLISTDEFKELPLPDRWFWLYFPLRPLLWFYHHYLRKSEA